MPYIPKLTGLLMVFALAFFACQNEEKNESEPIDHQQIDSTVVADVETTNVHASVEDDAADDPAIWINFNNPESSYVIGTNKTKGLDVYALNGSMVFSNNAGRINNVDVRYGFPLLDGSRIDIAAGSNRTSNSISIFKINIDGTLAPVNSRLLASNLNEVYGFCLYKDPVNNRFYAFVNGKSGGIEQWELIAVDGGQIDGKIVRTLKVPTQPEGAVCDDENRTLFIGEENNGIWKFDAAADGSEIGVLIEDLSNAKLSADIEGLTIYYAANNQGYLIASSQGNNSYALFERTGSNKYLGSFRIVDGASIDRTTETDGIDVCNLALGSLFPDGVFVAQDDANYNGDSLLPQNFKLVSWSQVARLFDPPLTTDNSYRSSAH
jgi:3-phytase